MNLKTSGGFKKPSAVMWSEFRGLQTTETSSMILWTLLFHMSCDRWCSHSPSMEKPANVFTGNRLLLLVPVRRSLGAPPQLHLSSTLAPPQLHPSSTSVPPHLHLSSISQLFSTANQRQRWSDVISSQPDQRKFNLCHNKHIIHVMKWDCAGGKR